MTRAEAEVPAPKKAATPDDDEEELLKRTSKWRKRYLRAECQKLHKQIVERKASEEVFLKNMMLFFRDEDGKSITQRSLASGGHIHEDHIYIYIYVIYIYTYTIYSYIQYIRIYLYNSLHAHNHIWLLLR